MDLSGNVSGMVVLPLSLVYFLQRLVYFLQRLGDLAEPEQSPDGLRFTKRRETAF
jgi:hypothetical protein